ncbi:MAG TPA: hypothetical protein VMU92_00480 [Acidobacteriaceae bacterium]|nr:hypothetical protein [Acidobacteriaceae bacterium]
MLTSTGNDQLEDYRTFVESLSLKSKSGQIVPLLSSPQESEFSTLNAGSEPLLTASVPQGIYTSATANIGSTYFSCVTYSQNIHINSFGYGYVPAQFVTINFPSSITVSGQSMTLSLDLDLSKSATWPLPCSTGTTFSITPTFELAPLDTAPGPAPGEMTALNGTVTTVDPATGSLTVIAADGPKEDVQQTITVTTGISWIIKADKNTVFSGINGLGGITVGAAINLDGTLQPDGSILATRISVLDNDSTSLSVAVGPVEEVVDFEPVVGVLTRQTEGPLIGELESTEMDFDWSNASFHIWSGLANLQTLPFPASFSDVDVVAGQNVAITSHAASIPYAPNFPSAATITLLPQTIDGTVIAVSTSGAFSVYTVTLAPYDLFPTLAFSNSYQTSPLTDPSTVIVYADGNTASLSSQPPAVGSLLRFNGVIFNDNGTLRMDCIRIMDGVAE